MTETTMKDIETCAKAFAEKREALAKELTTLERAIARLKDHRLPVIRQLVGDAAAAHSDLTAAIEATPDLFRRPKTRVLHGIRVGYRKESGSICFEDAGQVVKLIRRHLADQADALIKTKETPIKTALAQLTGAELKKIGVTITDDSDIVFVRPADSEVDKLVDALLADDAPAEATQAKEVA